MVKNPRKKTSPSRIRPLNRPELVQVEESDGQGPATIVTHGKGAKVISIKDMWEVVDEWWRASCTSSKQVGQKGSL